MTPFSKPHTTIYKSAIVPIAISCTVILKSQLGVIEGH